MVNISLPTFHSNLGRNIRLLSPQHVSICVARTLEWGDIMEVYSCGNRKLFTIDQAHVMTIPTSTKIVPNACIWCHLVILVIKSKSISKWIMPNWASHAHFSPFSNGLYQIGPLMPTMAHFQMDYAKLGLSYPLWPIKVDFDFIQRIYYLFEASWEFFLFTSISLSPVDKRN